MKELLWKALAWFVSREPVANYLINRATRTPYFDLPGYMERDWLFNGYHFDPNNEKIAHERKIKWLPSVRIHHILRADTARHLHDHPWDARTIILKGAYTERRLLSVDSRTDSAGNTVTFEEIKSSLRKRSDTATLNYGEYHAIDWVSEGGVYTMFFTWDYKGTWGFLVDGKKIQWREYEKLYPENVA